ncbi:MAG: serine aminopeptidase domain-containing protein [Fusobacteriaceae bacterium]
MREFDIFYGKNIENPRGVIQVIHGMGEHCARYENLAIFFEKKGYIVLGKNLKWHGETAKHNGELGLCNGNFLEIVKEQIDISDEIKKLYPNLDKYILGHSMGSFVAQQCLKSNYEGIKGYIVQGSSYKQPLLWKFGEKLTNGLFKVIGNTPNNFFKKIIFFGNNSKYLKEKDKFSWLTRDKDSREKFKRDKLCDFNYSMKFYKEFFLFLNKLYIEQSFKEIPREMNLLISAGYDDPIGAYGSSIKKLYEFYKEMGFKNVDLNIIPEFRHELHNEIDREKYFEYLYEWLEKTKR